MDYKTELLKAIENSWDIYDLSQRELGFARGLEKALAIFEQCEQENNNEHS